MAGLVRFKWTLLRLLCYCLSIETSANTVIWNMVPCKHPWEGKSAFKQTTLVQFDWNNERNVDPKTSVEHKIGRHGTRCGPKKEQNAQAYLVPLVIGAVMPIKVWYKALKPPSSYSSYWFVGAAQELLKLFWLLYTFYKLFVSCQLAKIQMYVHSSTFSQAHSNLGCSVSLQDIAMKTVQLGCWPFHFAFCFVSLGLC